MTDHIQEIDKIIQKAALDGVLTKGAVTQFSELIHERDALKKTTEEQGKELVKLNDVLRAVQGERDAARSDRDLMMTQMDDVKKREEEMLKLEITAEFQEKRVTDHKEMFTTVFRNSVLRKEIMTPTHPSAPDQYGTRQEGYPSKDTTEEEEK